MKFVIDRRRRRCFSQDGTELLLCADVFYQSGDRGCAELRLLNIKFAQTNN